MVPIPTSTEQTHLLTLLGTLITTLEAHPKFTAPNPHSGLLHTWDFIQRTRYILQNLENIRTGAPVEHPAMIPENPGAKTGDEKAKMAFTDVITRSITSDKIVRDPEMLAMMGSEGVDFGEDVRGASERVVEGVLGVKDDTVDPTGEQATEDQAPSA